MKELAHLNKYLYKYRLRFIAGTLFVALSNVFAIIPAQLVRDAMDLVVGSIEAYPLFDGFGVQPFFQQEFYLTVLFYGVLIVAMAFIRGGFLFLMRQTIIVVSRLIEYDLKNEIYTHYQSLPLSFYRKNNTGDLMSRISEDVSKVRMYVGPAVMYGINLLVSVILVVGYMLSVNVKLTLFSLLPLPVLSISIYYVNNLINKRSEEIQKGLSEMSTFVQEAFSGIRVLKAYVREDDSHKNFSKASDSYREKSLRLALVDALFFPLMLLLIGLSTILTVYVGGIEVMNGTITTGNIAEFIIYVNLLTWPVTALGWVTSIIQRAAASQKRINEFINTKNDILSEKNEKLEIKGEVEFENVSLTYPDSGIEALKGISFKVEAGKTLAVLGSTGSGKSTLANLLCRMYDPSQGTVKVDGHPLVEFDSSFYRGQLGYVPQDVFLFSETIKNNISFGADANHHSDEEITQAAADADLLANIESFQDGFETMVGERGITLSGGQKQRVSIARAIIRRPKILILDDCLSAVDTKTENIILNNLKRIMADRTSIVISHRVSSAKLADHIIVLADGQITQSGTHEELMQQAGEYRDLYEKQLHGEKEVNA